MGHLSSLGFHPYQKYIEKMGAIKNAIFENVTAQIGGHALPKICQQLIFNILFE